jgi:multidrug transporter EmrE-like cation transporter
MSPFWKFILLLVVFESIALYYIQKSASKNHQLSHPYMILAILIYGGLIPWLLLRTIKYQKVGIVNFTFNVLTTLVAFGIGIFFFSESLHITQIYGVIISLFGLWLVLR